MEPPLPNPSRCLQQAPWPTCGSAEQPPKQRLSAEAASYPSNQDIAPSPSHQDTVAFLEGLFAASYQTQQQQQHQQQEQQVQPEELEQQQVQSASSVPIEHRFEVCSGALLGGGWHGNTKIDVCDCPGEGE